MPYDSGHADRRLGRGPGALLAGGLPERLRACGHAVEVVPLEAGQPFPTETATAFELNRRVAGQVRAATGRGSFPLVLTGNCISSLGILGGLGPEDTGILWFDAHADFHTPETTESGFLDGMALAVATGQCWRTVASTIPGFRPIPAERVALVGARAFDPGERERFVAAGGAVLDPTTIQRAGIQGALEPVLARLRQRASRLYVHLDLDVLDPSEGRANSYAAPGGLTRVQVRGVLSRARQRFAVAGAALSAYDPAEDPEGRVLEAGIEFAMSLIPS